MNWLAQVVSHICLDQPRPSLKMETVGPGRLQEDLFQAPLIRDGWSLSRWPGFNFKLGNGKHLQNYGDTR